MSKEATITISNRQSLEVGTPVRLVHEHVPLPAIVTRAIGFLHTHVSETIKRPTRYALVYEHDDEGIIRARATKRTLEACGTIYTISAPENGHPFYFHDTAANHVGPKPIRSINIATDKVTARTEAYGKILPEMEDGK